MVDSLLRLRARARYALLMNRYRVHVRRGGAYIVDRCTGERFFWRHDAELVRSVARDLNASARAPGAERFVCAGSRPRSSAEGRGTGHA